MLRDVRVGAGSRGTIASLLALAILGNACLDDGSRENATRDAAAAGDAGSPSAPSGGAAVNVPSPSDADAARSAAPTGGAANASHQDGADVARPAPREEHEIAHVTRVLGTYTTPRNVHRKYVLIEPDLSDAQVLDVARRLHRLEPDTWYFLMDDDGEFDAMLAALPKTVDGDYDDWPADYVEAHLVARLMLEIGGDGEGRPVRQWRVEGGPTRPGVSAELR